MFGDYYFKNQSIMKNKSLLLLIQIFLTMEIIGQSNNTNFQNIAKEGSTLDWLYFKNPTSSSEVSPIDYLASIKSGLSLGTGDSFILEKTTTDELGIKHHRFNQFYNGIKVEGCDYILHEVEGNYTYANGKLGVGINKNINTTISIDVARDNALQHIGSNVWGWEVYEVDTIYLDSTSSNFILDTTGTHGPYPNGNLIIEHIQNNNSYADSDFRLSYRFDISSYSPELRSDKVYVNPSTGEVNNTYSLTSNSNCHTGSVNHIYYGTKSITTTKIHRWRYTLNDKCRGAKIKTKKGTPLGAYVCADPNNNFVNNWGDRASASIHWNVEMTYDYFVDEHQRNSFDGNDHKIISEYYNGPTGSYYDFTNDKMTFTGTEVSLEISAHEFTHGVTHHASNLNTTGESGGLHESFSDIFGVMTKYKKLPSYFDHKIKDNTDIIRDMSNPNNPIYNGNKHPDTYKGNYWPAVTNTQNDAHEHAGVQNYWFYLLAEEGSGTNDNGSGYYVAGIGKDKAAKIVYRNITTKITSSSQYLDARLGSIQAAMELYGECSYEVKQVIYAWDAVGVGVGQFPAGLKFDLAIKDNQVDDFTEPNYTAIFNWTNSQDIWVRNFPHYYTNFAVGLTHQNPIVGNSSQSPMIRTKITNSGCNKTTGTETVSVYYSIASTWAGWPDHYDGTYPNVGNIVGTTTIPVLNPGETTIVNTIWNPTTIPQIASGTSFNTSLLTRIDGGSTDPIQEFPLGRTLELVVSNNNVALKNVTIVNPIPVDINGGVNVNNWDVQSFIIRNVGGASTTGSFDFKFISDESLIEQSELYFLLPNEIYQQIGDFSNHVGISEHPSIENAILITEVLAELKNIQIDENEPHTIQPYFNFLSTEVVNTGYNFKISQLENGTDDHLGSVTYLIERPSRDYFEANSGDDLKVLEGKTIDILADDIGEDAIYNWYDASGNLLYTGKSITLTAAQTEALKLEVIAETDDYKDYDEKNIIVTPGLIHAINPQPVQNTANIEVEISSSATSATLVIYSTMQIPVNNYIISSTGESTINANLNGLPAGIYKAVLVVNGTIVDTKQFIKL
jgi:Zn-dependent metalloprotease